ncbi:hypothetical protein D3H55_16410 [Bacillus salacetis]|uniref:Uncharacterized protein n=1 Tax=Bacillus salacetis TaxID=2315464 RepID=A0A3A1QYL3_9BACI|nr:hypothetical protein D3H55_16410 [Bacillus salacetis]
MVPAILLYKRHLQSHKVSLPQGGLFSLSSGCGMVYFHPKSVILDREASVYSRYNDYFLKK